MSPRLNDPVTGAAIDPAAIIAARFPARYLDVTRSTRALAHLAGAKRSARRGRGVEFDEVRQYAAGDDVRAIDWRVTARSGEAHTKLFHEERERPVLVAVDLRDSMRFGSRNCFKSVLAAYTAGLVLWSALDRGERVGGMVMTDRETRDVRPRRSRNAVLQLIGDMQAPADSPATDKPSSASFAEQLRNLQRIARPGSSIFLISDFTDALEPAVLETLKRLARHTQITAIAISDPLERDLPLPGRYVVSDGEGRSTLDTASPGLRKRYREDYAAREQALGQQLQNLRIPLIQLSTEVSPLPILQRYFPAR